MQDDYKDAEDVEFVEIDKNPNFDEPPRLKKSKKNKIFLGICGGLGEYFNVSPVLFRLIFIIATFFSSWTLVIYLILAVTLKSEKNESDEKKSIVYLLGVLLAFIGVFNIVVYNSTILTYLWAQIPSDLLMGLIFFLTGLYLKSNISKFAHKDDDGIKQPIGLYKEKNGKFLGGVCVGLSKYFIVSLNKVRFYFVLLGFISFGVFGLFYFLMWIVLSQNPEVVDETN